MLSTAPNPSLSRRGMLLAPILVRKGNAFSSSLIRREMLLVPLLDKDGLGAVDNTNSNHILKQQQLQLAK
jgi:hypothetical protein